MTQDTILHADGIVKQFGGLVALDHVSFEIPRGSITGIIGPNGAGKSTLFNVITGVLSPDAGRVTLNNERIENRSPPEVAAAGVGRTFQTPRVFGGMTVRENLHFAPQRQTGETIIGAVFRGSTVDREEDTIREKAEGVLELLDVDHLADEYARNLSGGQRKLLELGRVLMTDPEILLLDEPVEGVNPALQTDLIDRLHRLNDEGMTVVMIEHNMDVVMENCDKIIVLHNGQTLATGTPAEIQQDESVIDAYLGGLEA